MKPTTPLNRRDFLRTTTSLAASLSLLPATELLSFDTHTRCWIPKGKGRDPVAALPKLDGTLIADPSALAALADDFGHIVHRTPKAILRPGSVQDIIKTIRYARDHHLRITSRGNGHTAFGQSQVEAGIVIDLRTLNQIHSITPDRVVVDAGVIWRDLLKATLAQGATPPVLTDYTRLTVGGTLSVGGISGRSYQQGAQVDQVLELQVVTALGQLVTCSPTTNQALFEATLAGLGLCAIIVQATLRLIPAKERAHTHRLFYPDVPSLLGDLRLLANDQRFDYLRGNGVAVPGAPGGFAFFLEATSYYNQPDELPQNPLAGLRYLAGREQVEDRTYWEQTDLVVAALDAHPDPRPHPWLDLLVADSKMDAFATQTIARLNAAQFLPGSLLLFYPLVKSRLKRPLLRTPDEDSFFLFDLLRTVPADPAAVQAVLRENRTLYEQNRTLGGSFYAISALPMKPQDWEKHFGPFWSGLVRSKRQHDPHQLFGAGLQVFS